MLRVASAAAAMTTAALLSGGSPLQAARRRAEKSDRAGRFEPVPIKCGDGTLVTPWSTPTRALQLGRLKDEEFDILVIGGGCVGAGCALDAASRGLSVALVERSDFASGTSSRSTKLIHGGVRYLQNAFMKLDFGQYELVEEALEERAFMLGAAPYICRPLPIMLPCYSWWEVPFYWVGLKVYDLIAGSRRMLPNSHYISRAEALHQFPMLNERGLKGAIVYYDGQMNDARLNLMVALTAAQKGAAVTNHVSVVSLNKDAAGKLCGARVRDGMTGEEWDVRARAVVNATGPWTDSITKMDDSAAPEVIVPAAGVHVVLPDHYAPSHMGLIVPRTRDSRVLFYLPWEGSTIVGTTDSKSDLTETPSPTDEEVLFILDESNRFLDRTARPSDVRSAWSGLRPLVRDPTAAAGDTKSFSRNHVVMTSDSQLVTICGGKWTTYRRMAQDAIDAVLRTVPSLGGAGDSLTHDMKLLGSDRVGIVCDQKFDRITVTLRDQYDLGKDLATHLMHNYGTRALQVAEIARAGFGKRLHSKLPILEAEVVFAVEQEYAMTVVDVLARRTRIAFLDSRAARAALPRVADIMASRLRWSDDEKKAQIASALAFLETMH